jgi:predicted esterase
MIYKIILSFATCILTLLSYNNSKSISLTKTTLTQKQQAATLPPCTGNRFKEDVFPQLDVYQDIKYSHSKDMQHKMTSLKMDIFSPQEDTMQLRPLVIWAHGGYFCFGDKSDIHSLCQFVSAKGWVSASIDYRKWEKRRTPNQVEYMETAIKATHDMHAAIRFFKADAAGDNFYKIDTNKIFVGGYSAGGVMAAQVAYLDLLEEVPTDVQEILTRNGGLTGDSGSSGHTSTIAGSIVIAGAVYNKDIIKNGTHPPFLGIQGTEDKVVPYNRGWACSPKGTQIMEVDGTEVIHKTNQSLELQTTLLSLSEGDHGAPFNENTVESTLASIHKFLLENTCP